jgi:hypothetical protein
MHGVADCIRGCITPIVPQATEWQRIGNQVDAAMIPARADFVKVQGMHSGWLLRSDIGQVIKTIVDDEAAFPDYAMPKKTDGRKKQVRKKPTR